MEENIEKPAESLNLERYWAVVSRRRWHFLIPLFVGWAITWGITWVVPSVYRSGTLILVEQPTVPSQYVMPNVTGNLQDRLQSITQQILSRTRLSHIIESLNLYPNERKNHPADELVDRMRKDIDIDLVRSADREELTAFNVYYLSSDPHVAQQVTSALTNLFISENLEARQGQSESTTKFLESQLEQARQNLSEQEEKVREFKDQHLGELPGQLQANLQILGSLQGQLQTESDVLNRAKQQNVYLESLLTQYRSAQQSTKTGEKSGVGLPAIDQELERLRAQLADISSHYTDKHPDVRKLREQIAKTEKMKQQLMEQMQNQPAVKPDDDSATAMVRETGPMMELQSQLKVNRLEIANRERSIRELQARIGDYQSRLNREPIREQQLTDITRGYDQSRANYDSLLKKKNDSELATSLELQQQGEHFKILDPPSLPTRPYSPDRLKWSGIGLGIGFVLGGVITGAAEVLDDRVYSEKELKRLVPVSVMVEIPNLSTVGEDSSPVRNDWLIWGVSSLMIAVILAGTAFSYLRG